MVCLEVLDGAAVVGSAVYTVTTGKRRSLYGGASSVASTAHSDGACLPYISNVQYCCLLPRASTTEIFDELGFRDARVYGADSRKCEDVSRAGAQRQQR